MSNSVALQRYLTLFEPFLALEEVTEICVNRPGKVWIEQKGVFRCEAVADLTEAYLWQFARLVAEFNQREISAEHPTLSSVLPNGLRVQFVVPPACEKGSFVCSIRQHGVKAKSLEEYFSFPLIELIEVSHQQATPRAVDEELLKAYFNKDFETFLRLAVLQRKNIIISGGTSTGKTTFLNALVGIIPLSERLITIETDREVKMAHPNAVHLLAAEEGVSTANITMLGLLKAALRLRPDRILVSELRAEEAFPYLRAINSGHPGSITTLHADSPKTCFEQLAFMVMQGGSNLTKQELIAYAKSIINIVVQIKRSAKGERYLSEIYFDAAEREKSDLMPCAKTA